jgi:hypothetical protein
MAQGQALMPRYSLTALKLGRPFVDPNHLNRYVAALTAAGWTDAAGTQGRLRSTADGDLQTQGGQA